MDRVCRVLLLSVCAATVFAQTAAQPLAPGLETDWDIAPVIQEIGAHAGRLQAALDKIDARAWVEKGASETYAEQVQAASSQAAAMAVQAKALAAKPEQLALSLELFFRMQGVETILLSVEEGLRRYQSPAAAEALTSLEAEIGGDRDRFQNYIVNFAADRERALQVMDKEAQRCRGILTAPPPASTKTGKKK
jgi:hypothetical protein